MRRLLVRLVAAGFGLGALAAIAGLPYGRVNPRAFAELYHGSTDTTGMFHMAIDCDPAGPTTQSGCSIGPLLPSTIDVDVTVGNSTGASALLAGFIFTLNNDDAARIDAVTPGSCFAPKLECNPDFLDSGESPEGLTGVDWNCDPVLADQDGNNANGDQSLMSCINAFSAPTLASGPGHLDLARITYSVGFYPPTELPASVALTLQDAALYDETATELMSCNPVVETVGLCFGATINITYHELPTPTWTSTPTPVATPTPADYDGDGVPDDVDNCLTTYNPGQENDIDGNFISAQGLHVDDYSRAYSDEYGDVCDPDLDNDRRSNEYESGYWDSCGLTVDYLPDTDGDRALDQAECQLGTDPRDAGSKPSPTTCASYLGVGVTTDTDGDGLRDYLEFCGYATQANTANTDGDPGTDGCEAISLNNDLKVNSGDQLLLLQEYLRMAPPAKLANYDLNKDGPINSGDQLLMLQFFGICP